MELIEKMFDKFDHFEKNRKVKEEIINSLKEEISTFKGRVKILQKESNVQEQYSRRNYLLVYGIEENKDESTEDLVVNFVKNTIDIGLCEKGIGRSHQIAKPSPQKKRPAIVNFV